MITINKNCVIIGRQWQGACNKETPPSYIISIQHLQAGEVGYAHPRAYLDGGKLRITLPIFPKPFKNAMLVRCTEKHSSGDDRYSSYEVIFLGAHQW